MQAFLVRVFKVVYILLLLSFFIAPINVDYNFMISIYQVLLFIGLIILQYIFIGSFSPFKLFKIVPKNL